MSELRKQHIELCNRYDSAVIEFNSLHKKAKAVKQNTIVPLENEIRLLEEKIRKEQKNA